MKLIEACALYTCSRDVHQLVQTEVTLRANLPAMLTMSHGSHIIYSNVRSASSRSG